jgi:hypothetical protein
VAERRSDLAVGEAHRLTDGTGAPRGRVSTVRIDPPTVFELPRRIPPRAFQTRAVPD